MQFVVRDYRRSFNYDPMEYYNLKNSFNITEIPSLKFLPIRYDFYFHSGLRGYVNKLINKESTDKTLLYSRYGKNSGSLTEIIIDCSKKAGHHGVFAEIHEGLNQREKMYVERLDGIVVISNALRNLLLNIGISESKILVAPSGVDLDAYMQYASKNKMELREKLSLPNDKKLAVYTGHLYRDRGLEILVDSAKYIGDQTEILIVGGLPEDINRLQKLVDDSGLSDRISLLGSRPVSEIPLYQLSADVLVMPYPEHWKLKNWSSPMKMFEYMASNRPIVASDFPIVREVLNDKNSHLVKPGDPAALAEGINKCLGDEAYSRSISQIAFEDVKEYTWDRRAQRILDFMQSL